MKQATSRKLSEICELIIDCEHKTAPNQTTGYPSVRTPNIGRGRLMLENVNRVTEGTYNAWTRRAVPQAGDLVLAREAPAGNVAIIPDNLKVCLGQRTVLIRPDQSQVEPHYLLYLLLDERTQARLLSYSSGATVAHVNMSDIRGLPLPELPSLRIQKKIASILSAYDDLIENNIRRIKILEEMAQALYREWFVHFRFPGHEKVKMVDSPLGKMPEGWEVMPIGRAVETLGGGTPSTKNPEYWESGDIIWFTPSDLTANAAMFISDSAKRINAKGFQNSSARMFPAYSVMMTSRATIGVTAINTRPACTNQGFVICVPNERVSFHQLYFWIEENKEKIISVASGATYKEISRNEFREFPIAVADKDKNLLFVEILTPIAKQIENLLAKNTNLCRTHDLLLPKLISGGVNVNELDIDEGKRVT